MPQSDQPNFRKIPVIGKAQRPPHLSYVIGSDPLNEAFATFWDFENLVASFNATTPLLQDRWKIPGYPVLRLIYTNYPVYKPVSESIRRRRQGGVSWHFEILLVPRDLRQTLQPLIIEMGLPLLLKWMTRPGFPAPHLRRAWVELWWFEDTQTMKLHEPKE